MEYGANFRPGESVPLNAGTGSTNQAFAIPKSAGLPHCAVTNEGTVTAFVAFGKGKGTFAQLPGTGGTDNATPVLAGETMVLDKGEADTVAAITRSGNAQLYFTAGIGA